MITKPMDVLHHYEIRKSKKQKSSFITAVTAYASSLRYTTKVEKGSFGCRNIVIGDPEKADYLITAHYDTCAWMPMPNMVTPFNLVAYCLYQLLILAVLFVVTMPAGVLIGWCLNSETIGYWIGYGLYWLLWIGLMFGPANRHTANDNTSGVVTVLEIMGSLPENMRDRVCFVLFDLEEAGLLGSASYRKTHKAATDRQIVLNMDCVGDGDEIFLIPGKTLRKNDGYMAKLQRIAGTWGKKSLAVHKEGFVFYPSDHVHFPKGVAIAAFQRNKLLGCYYGRIHTHRDMILDRTNVNILRTALISLIAQY